MTRLACCVYATGNEGRRKAGNIWTRAAAAAAAAAGRDWARLGEESLPLSGL